VGEYRDIINDLERRVKALPEYQKIVWEEYYTTVPGAGMVEKVRGSAHWMCKPYFRPLKDDSQPSDSAYREQRRGEIDKMVEETGLSRRMLRKRERRRIAGQKIISQAQKKVYIKCTRCNQPAGQGCLSTMCRKCCRYACSRQFKDCKVHRFKFSDRADIVPIAAVVASENIKEDEDLSQVSLCAAVDD